MKNKFSIIDQLKEISRDSLMKKSKENEDGEIQAKDLIDYTNELMDAKINGTSGYLRRNLFKSDAMFLTSPDLTSDMEDMKTKMQ